MFCKGPLGSSKLLGGQPRARKDEEYGDLYELDSDRGTASVFVAWIDPDPRNALFRAEAGSAVEPCVEMRTSIIVV